LDNVRVTGLAVPPVRIAITVAVVVDPATIDVVVGFTDSE
jgi:hypothetical protein